MGSFRWLVEFLALGSASAQIFELEGRYWITRTDAQVRVERFGVATDIDLKTDLGVSDEGFPEGQVTFAHGGNRFRFAFTPIHYSGDHNVSRTIVFNGRTYTFGTRVISNIDVNYLRFSWNYFFLRRSRLKIGPMLEGNGFLQDLSLKAPSLGIEQSENLSVGAPAIGVAVEYSPRGILHVQGEVAGISVGRYGYILRSEVGVKLTPVRHVGITAGYRTFDLHADYRPDFVKLRVHGPFVGASVRF